MLARDQRYSEILILTVPILLIMSTTFMVGLPRYRVAIEPELAIMAVLGLTWIADRWNFSRQSFSELNSS